jgi:hypothetical protein
VGPIWGSVVVKKSRTDTGFIGVLRASSMKEGWEEIDVPTFRRLAEQVYEQASRRAFDLERD